MNEEDRKTEATMALVALLIVVAVIVAAGYFLVTWRECAGPGKEYKQTPDGPACVSTGR